MKTSFKIILCLLIIGGFILPQSNAMGTSKNDGITIMIHQQPVSFPGAPHMPAFNPFYAELESGYVLLGSYSYCGIVDVSLTSTAGDDYSTVFDTSNGTVNIPVSGYSGDYVLLITTSAGTEYIGEFSI